MGGEQFYFELQNEEPPYADTTEAKVYLKEAIARYERDNKKKNIPAYLIRYR